jgi:hypothetical protein
MDLPLIIKKVEDQAIQVHMEVDTILERALSNKKLKTKHGEVNSI